MVSHPTSRFLHFVTKLSSNSHATINLAAAHFAYLTLSSWHAGAILSCGCLLSGYGMDLTVDEATVLGVELEPPLSSGAEPKIGEGEGGG